MRVLVLTSTPREPDNHLLWDGLQQFAAVEVVYVGKDEQRQLGKLLRRFDLACYDRVILDLLFRNLSPQSRLLSNIPGLVLYEEDACQEFIQDSKWFGKFSAFYRKLPHARVIFTGYRVCQQFKSLGVDACFLPKGYDSSKLCDMGQARDIELGFIGRLASDAYKDRREFLERAAREHGLQIMRTEPGDAYRETLNRIRIFLSADIGLGEYMAKNFEAMACGCVLLAYRQGEGEEQALGLVEGENVLLYDDYSDCFRQLRELRSRPERFAGLAQSAANLARQRFDYAAQASALFDCLQTMPRSAPVKSGWRQTLRSWITKCVP